jgi:orotidine-5'-phosphate decarboxylase
MTDERVIVALDFNRFEEAKACVEEIGEAVSFYKVGMELYYAAGNDIVRYLKDKGKRVFVDLKLHDIPNTVGRALAVLTGLGADILNVHASGGARMMREAAQSVRQAAQALGAPAPKLIAVTVLTSMGPEDLAAVGVGKPVAGQVVSLAELARSCGIDGVVASALEAPALRQACGPDFLIVTPGVRPAGAAAGDQRRVTTPGQAFAAGATHIVVGRPVTQAADRKKAALAIIEETLRSA